ncbi:hypothetical protein JL475_33580 [Streptomyces sp. M2CJ-2]|uniref:hypothetical protein n=1 Tax=Streptomyces sp. M2CJ-2 TaxID=2803948 RepID=UPI0019276342|nr:hypothetical protein [Streptomyces sp. M2CJ-2]MBL3670805.1 hypothetical protein [Streptomyces sp. M2CJ-2]
MPEHKMIIIKGIRVRAEDEGRYRARTGGSAGPLTRAQADPRQQEPQGEQEPAEQGGFDPAEHTVLQVIAHLAEADEEETARVLDIEAQGEKRKGLLERRAEFLAEARQRAAGGSGGGA